VKHLKRHKMKNKIFLFVILVQSASVVLAQSLPSIEGVEKLDIEGFNARFSPSGHKLLFTDNHFRGLSLYDIASRSVDSDLALRGANGYGAQITDEEVIFQQASQEGFYSLNLKSKEVKQVDVGNLHKPATMMGLSKTSRRLEAQESADLRSIVIVSSSKNQKQIAPLGTQDYLNVSLSPDQSKVLFRVSGRGAFISDLDGKVLADLGNVEFPCWLDDDTVVYTETEDDGYVYTASDLYISKWSVGKSAKLELPKTLIPLYPDVNKDQRKLVFNTPEGMIYLLTMRD
jgi:hypothetical protein